MSKLCVRFCTSAFLLTLPAVYNSAIFASDKSMKLGELRLFMTSEQRSLIDQKPIVEIAKDVAEPEITQEVDVKVIPRTAKITLNGVVRRPDGTSVLFLNNGTEKVQQRRSSDSNDFSHSMLFENTRVTLTPGHSVTVEVDGG